jgi:hypothetical protein
MEKAIEETEQKNPSIDMSMIKQSRQRLKRQTATDVVPLVEFHDALSQSTTFSSEIGQQS